MGVEVPFHVRIKIQTHNIHTLMHPCAHGQTIMCVCVRACSHIRALLLIPGKRIITPADELYLFAHILVCSDSEGLLCSSA